MAKQILNRAGKGAKASSFDPNAIIKGFREEKDRQIKQKNDELDRLVKEQDRSLLMEERRSRIEAQKDLMKSRKLRRQKEFQDMFGREPDVLDPSEFGSVNDIATRAVTKLTDDRDAVMQSLEDNNTPENRQKLREIDASINKIKLGYDKINELGDKAMDKIADGTISGVDKDTYIDKIQRIKNGKASIQWDDKHNPSFIYHDEEGNPIDVDNIQDLINGDVDVIEHYDVATEMQNLAKTKGVSDSTGATGAQFKGLGALQRRALASDIDSIVMDDAVVADVLFQMGENKEGKRKGFSEAERDAVAVRLMESAVSSVSTKFKAAETEEEELPESPVELVTTTGGKAQAAIIGQGADTKAFDMVFNPNVELEAVDGSPINEILYNSSTGEIVLRGDTVDKFKEVVKVDDDTGEVITTTTEGTDVSEKVITDVTEITDLIKDLPNPNKKGKKFRSLQEFKEFISGDKATPTQPTENDPLGLGI